MSFQTRKTFVYLRNTNWDFFFFTFFFSHTTHNIQNTTKQTNRHILNISRSNQKGGGEGRTTRTQKSLLYTITYVQQKTLPSINGRRPGPTNSRRCTFTWHYLQEATEKLRYFWWNLRAFWPCIESNSTDMFRYKDIVKIVHVTSVVQP